MPDLSEPATAAAAGEPARADEPAPADEVLLGSVALAQRALLEVTAPETVGSMTGHVVEGEHVLSLHFAAGLAGYPGWYWSVTLARVEGGDPTVLETELLPGEPALLAPDWIPWSERLADYRAAQAAAALEAAESSAEQGDDDVEDAADELDPDGDDVFDGIDIDALDEDDSDDEDDGSDEDDSDDEDDDSDEDDSDEDDDDE